MDKKVSMAIYRIIIGCIRPYLKITEGENKASHRIVKLTPVMPQSLRA